MLPAPATGSRSASRRPASSLRPAPPTRGSSSAGRKERRLGRQDAVWRSCRIAAGPQARIRRTKLSATRASTRVREISTVRWSGTSAPRKRSEAADRASPRRYTRPSVGAAHERAAVATGRSASGRGAGRSRRTTSRADNLAGVRVAHQRSSQTRGRLDTAREREVDLLLDDAKRNRIANATAGAASTRICTGAQGNPVHRAKANRCFSRSESGRRWDRTGLLGRSSTKPGGAKSPSKARASRIRAGASARSSSRRRTSTAARRGGAASSTASRSVRPTKGSSKGAERRAVEERDRDGGGPRDGEKRPRLAEDVVRRHERAGRTFDSRLASSWRPSPRNTSARSRTRCRRRSRV